MFKKKCLIGVAVICLTALCLQSAHATDFFDRHPGYRQADAHLNEVISSLQSKTGDVPTTSIYDEKTAYLEAKKSLEIIEHAAQSAHISAAQIRAAKVDAATSKMENQTRLRQVLKQLEHAREEIIQEKEDSQFAGIRAKLAKHIDTAIYYTSQALSDKNQADCGRFLETQMSGHLVLHPGSFIRTLQGARIIQKKSYNNIDCINYFKSDKPLNVWGMKVSSVLAWEAEDPVFKSPPVQCPPPTIGVVVPYSNKYVLSHLPTTNSKIIKVRKAQELEPYYEDVHGHDVLRRPAQRVLTEIIYQETIEAED